MTDRPPVETPCVSTPEEEEFFQAREEAAKRARPLHSPPAYGLGQSNRKTIRGSEDF